MNSETSSEARQQIVDTCRRLNDLGLTHGTSGNVSVRTTGGFLVSPSAVAYSSFKPSDVVTVGLDGTISGGRPSSEWLMHRDLYVARADVGAIIHAHPDYCTALSCQRRSIPPFHYMVAIAGGDSIRCADYALFGTQALSDAVLRAIRGRNACLIGNHGMICVGSDLDDTLILAEEVEALARQYWLSCAAGEPVLLSESEMIEVIDRFKTYKSGKSVSNA